METDLHFVVLSGFTSPFYVDNFVGGEEGYVHACRAGRCMHVCECEDNFSKRFKETVRINSFNIEFISSILIRLWLPKLKTLMNTKAKQTKA